MALKELIDKYGKSKAELDVIKKDVDATNAEIKQLMTSEKIENAEGDTFKATCKEIKSESFNDEKLVAKLRSMWSEHNGSMACPYVKMIYVPDMEEIERALYSGEIKAEDIADCKEVKTTLRLTVSKIKK